MLVANSLLFVPSNFSVCTHICQCAIYGFKNFLSMLINILLRFTMLIKLIKRLDSIYIIQ